MKRNSVRRIGAFTALIAAIVMGVVWSIATPTTPASGKPLEANRFKYPIDLRPVNSTQPALWVGQSNRNGSIIEVQRVPTRAGTPGLSGTPTTVFKIANNGDLTVNSALGVPGGIVASGALNASAGQTFAGIMSLTAATSITATTGALAALGHWQPLTASGTVSPTITPGTAGVLTCFQNTSAQNIVFVDTGNVVLSGDFTMGQYDTLCGRSDGTRWIEISESDN